MLAPVAKRVRLVQEALVWVLPGRDRPEIAREIKEQPAYYEKKNDEP